MTIVKIYVFTKYSSLGASSRYRTYQYLPLLGKCGIEPTVSPLFDDAYLSNKYRVGSASFGDVVRALFRRIRAIIVVPRQSSVLIEYELLPYCPAILEHWLKWRGCRLLLDYDDAIFHKYDLHRHFLVRALLGGKIARLMRMADRVVVGNNYLAEYARRAGASDVEVLPTVLDLRKYEQRTSSNASPYFTIGWLGSPSTAQYLKLIQPALAQVCKQRSVRIRLIGSGPIDLADIPAELIPWTETGEVKEISALDVGIMPLPDEPWARGKCGFKLIQYMACGIPVVASSVGANTEIVSDGEQGYLASTIEDWVEALYSLISSPELGFKMGAAGRQRVEQRYCLEVTAPRWVSMLKTLCN
jgi:glycosyltransferase involved in cell wall biosynthesis